MNEQGQPSQEAGQHSAESSQTVQLPAQQAQVDTPQPIAPQAQTVTPKKSKSKWLLPVAIIATILVIGAGAYGYMGIYLQSPENMWKQAMNNTGDALNGYVNAEQKSYTGGKISGTFAMASPTIADGSITGAYSGNNSVMNISAGAMGVRATAEIRTITTEPATSPDIYLKVDGLKSIGAILGSTNPYGALIQQIDGNWYFIDHTLTAKATSQVSATTESTQQLQKDVQQVAKSVNAVLQDYLFTTDSAKAVVVIKETLGKEDFKGRPTQKYLAQVRKQQLKDMVTALKDSLKSTKANDWVVGNSGKTFEQQMEYDQLLKEIDAIPDDKLTAEVWVDIGLKYIRNVRIAMPDQKQGTTSTVDIMLDYTGGDNVPITMTTTTKDAAGEGSVQLGITLYKNSSKIDVSGVVVGLQDGQKVDGNIKISVEPTNDELVVTKPDGAKNIVELLGGVLGANTIDGIPSGNTLAEYLNSF